MSDLLMPSAAPIPYVLIKRAPRSERTARLARSRCGLADISPCKGGLVFDHCHAHGWLRDVLCTGHNVLLGKIESARRTPHVIVTVLGPVAAVLGRCPGCAVTIANELHADGLLTRLLDRDDVQAAMLEEIARYA